MGIIFIAAAATAVKPSWAEIELPDLGPVSTELSVEHARKIGKAWLRLFRRQIDTDDDPLLQDYLHFLSYKLARKSTLRDVKLEVVVVDNAHLNAFAVPGGIIGVHNGLLLYAQHEGELAAVLAHEIAHLELKHFARNREQAKRRALPTLLGILTGVALAVAGDGEAAIALLSTTQAAGLAQSLRYSRQHELEADRAGSRILHQSAISPDYVPAIFERMLKDYRYASRPPEFLLTHPVSERRIAQGREYARTLKKQKINQPKWVFDSQFSLMQARVRVKLADDPKREVEFWNNRLRNTDNAANKQVMRYGKVLALMRLNRLDEARQTLKPLLSDENPALPFIYTAAEIALQSGNAARIIPLLEHHWNLQPNNFPLGYIYAKILNSTGDTLKAIPMLRNLLRIKSQTPELWMLLAESYGLSGNIIGVHQANAEYLILTGRLQDAKRRLQYAQRLALDDFQKISQIRNRIKEIIALQGDQRLLGG